MKLYDIEFEAARSAFNLYAGAWPSEPLPADPWAALQVRIVRWQVHNFGIVPASHQTLGVGEEIGELAEALYGDLDQPESFNHTTAVFDQAAVVDAISDAMVYATQLATCWRLDAGTLWRASDVFFVPNAIYAPRPTSLTLLAMAATVGRMNRAALKADQNIRGYGDRDKSRRVVADNITRLFYLARTLGAQLHINVFKGFVATVEQVLTRDWKRFPKNGRTE